MKKTAQEIHNKQIEGLSNGMSIQEAKELAAAKEQILTDQKAEEKQTAVWPYVMVAIIIAAYLFVSIYQHLTIL